MYTKYFFFLTQQSIFWERREKNKQRQTMTCNLRRKISELFDSNINILFFDPSFAKSSYNFDICAANDTVIGSCVCVSRNDVSLFMKIRFIGYAPKCSIERQTNTHCVCVWYADWMADISCEWNFHGREHRIQFTLNSPLLDLQWACSF